MKRSGPATSEALRANPPIPKGILLPSETEGFKNMKTFLLRGGERIFLDGKNGSFFVIQLCSKLGYKHQLTTGSYLV